MKPQNKSANKNTLRISLSYSALSKWALETLPALVVSKTKGSLLRHSKCRRTTCWRKGAVAAVCNAVERGRLHGALLSTGAAVSGNGQRHLSSKSVVEA